MDKHSRIYVAGYDCRVGNAIVRSQRATGCMDVVARFRGQSNLDNQAHPRL